MGVFGWVSMGEIGKLNLGYDSCRSRWQRRVGVFGWVTMGEIDELDVRTASAA